MNSDILLEKNEACKLASQVQCAGGKWDGEADFIWQKTWKSCTHPFHKGYRLREGKARVHCWHQLQAHRRAKDSNAASARVERNTGPSLGCTMHHWPKGHQVDWWPGNIAICC